MNDASARGWPGIGPALGIAGQLLRAGHECVELCEVFGGQQFVYLAGSLVGFGLKHPTQHAARGHGAEVGERNQAAQEGEQAQCSHDDDEDGHCRMVAPGDPVEAICRVWWVLGGYFWTKREPVKKTGASSKTCWPSGLVGFVGFEGFTNRRSASKCFAQGTGLHPAGTHTNSNLRYPKRTTYKAYKLVFIGGFVGS